MYLNNALLNCCYGDYVLYSKYGWFGLHMKMKTRHIKRIFFIESSPLSFDSFDNRQTKPSQTKQKCVVMVVLVGNWYPWMMNWLTEWIEQFWKMKTILLTEYICKLFYAPPNIIIVKSQKKNIFTKTDKQTDTRVNQGFLSHARNSNKYREFVFYRLSYWGKQEIMTSNFFLNRNFLHDFMYFTLDIAVNVLFSYPFKKKITWKSRKYRNENDLVFLKHVCDIVRSQ